MYSLRLLSFLRPYWRRVLVATICVFAAGAYIMVLLAASLALMLFTNWKLTLVVWAFIPFIVWRSTVMAFKLRPMWTAIQEGLARIATVLQEALTGARVVKAFAREEFEGEKFSREAEAVYIDSYA